MKVKVIQIKLPTMRFFQHLVLVAVLNLLMLNPNSFAAFPQCLWDAEVQIANQDAVLKYSLNDRNEKTIEIPGGPKCKVKIQEYDNMETAWVTCKSATSDDAIGMRIDVIQRLSFPNCAQSNQGKLTFHDKAGKHFAILDIKGRCN